MHRLLPLLIAALALSGCGRKPPGGPPPDPGPVVVGPESTTTVRRDTLETGPRLSGSLQPKRVAAIRAEVAGAVSGVTVDLGEPVKAGQVLARIDDRAMRDALRSAETSVKTAQGDLEMAQRQEERVAKLAAAGALAERDLEVAKTARAGVEARLEEARARVASSRKLLDSTVVEAPFDGVIAKRAAQSGDVVGVNALLFEVMDPSSMRLEASVPSDDLSALAPGTPVQFEVRGFPGQSFTGSIERVAPAADAATRQIPVIVAIPNPGGRLLAGLFAEGRVAARQQEGLVLPIGAVEQAGDTATVMRVRDGKVERVPVAVGLRDDRSEQIEVTQGLAAGDVVLVGPARTLTPGTAVKLSDPAAPASTASPASKP